jgi:hypothetical protein
VLQLINKTLKSLEFLLFMFCPLFP